MNALYDAPAEADEAAYLEEFELGLVAEDDDSQDAPSPWIARVCAAGALAAHIALIGIVLGTGLGWSFPHRGVDFARVIDVELEPRLPRIERVAVGGAPKDAAVATDATEEADSVPVQDRLALRSALDSLAAAGAAETLETIALNLDAETDVGAGAIPVRGGEPPELATSRAPIDVAGDAASQVASSPPALSLSLAPARDITAKPDIRQIAESLNRPAIVASEAADESVVLQLALEPAQESAVAQTGSGIKVEETVVALSEPQEAEGSPVIRAEPQEAEGSPVIRAEPVQPGDTVLAQTETDEAEGEAEQGSAEDADVRAPKARAAEASAAEARAAETRRAAAKKAANERARAAADAARKRNEEVRRREAEKRKAAARKKSQVGAKSNRLGSARRYAGMVRARVARAKPGLKGPSSVTIAYSVAPDGSLRYAKVVGANNSGIFMNQSSVSAVRGAAPFGPPPAGMTPGQLSFTVTFTYR